MKKALASLAGIAILSLSALGAANAADGKALYTEKLCNTCHGVDADTPIMPNYPKLSGQNAEYAAQQIKDIRDGKRTNGLAAAMKPMVANLTDEEAMAISEYLQSLGE